jgi:cytosine-specific methyltransferase
LDFVKVCNKFGDNPRNDLTSVEFKIIVSMWDYDILLAGFPCQPFISQGNLEGFNDATKGAIMFNISLFVEINLMICINSSKIKMLKC